MRRLHAKLYKLSLFGLLLSAGVLILFCVTTYYYFGYLGRTGGVAVERGVLIISLGPYPTISPWVGGGGWFSILWFPDYQTAGSASLFVLPLWILFLFIAVPSAILWRGTRLPPHGHCQECGYDLTGNVSGVCPECGTKVEQP